MTNNSMSVTRCDANFVILYQGLNTNLSMLCVDRQGKYVSHSNDLLELSNSDINTFCVITKALVRTDMAVVIYADYTLNETSYSVVQKYDAASSLIKRANWFPKIHWLTPCGKNLVGLKLKNNHYSLVLLNDELITVEVIGSERPNLPFHFPLSIKQFSVNVDYYFLLDDKSIQMMLKSSGKIVKSFYIDANSFSLYMDRYILTLNDNNPYMKSKMKKMCSYDFSGSAENVLVSAESHKFLSDNIELMDFIPDKELLFLSWSSFAPEQVHN